MMCTLTVSLHSLTCLGVLPNKYRMHLRTLWIVGYKNGDAANTCVSSSPIALAARQENKVQSATHTGGFLYDLSSAIADESSSEMDSRMVPSINLAKTNPPSSSRSSAATHNIRI